MKRIILALLFSCAACGYTSTDNESVGQPKKLHNEHPLDWCEDYQDVDVSLGVLRNGTGSTSPNDDTFYITDPAQADTLKLAIAGGSIVKIRYDEKRASWCHPDYQIRSVEIIDGGGK